MIRSTRAAFWFASFLVAAFALNSASTVQAQWAPDRAYTEGPGIRVGNLELHPGVALRGGYDTNVFRTRDNRKGAAILGFTPHLHLSTLKQQRLSQGEDAAGAPGQLPPPVAFDLGLAATFFKYFADNAPDNLEADTSAALSVLPERTFGFDLSAAYARSTRPFTEAARGCDGGFFGNCFALNRITPKLLVRGQSRGGVLKGSLGYAPMVQLYENRVFNYLNSVQHDVPAALAWKFLPFTALLFDGVYTRQDYLNTEPDDQANAALLLSNANRYQARVGINGAVTTRLSARGLVGYSVVALARDALDDRQDAVGEAALTFAWAPGSSVEAGYQRLLDISNLGGWMQQDRGYAKTSMLFAQMFMLSLDAGVAHVKYGRMLQPDGDPLGEGGEDRREDVRIDGGIHGEYRATNWFAVMADFTALATLTDFEYDRSTVNAQGVRVANPFPAQFVSFQMFGGVRFHY